MDSSTNIKGFDDVYENIDNEAIDFQDTPEEYYEEQFDITLIIVGVIVLLVIVAIIVMVIVRKKSSGHADQIASDTFAERTKGKPVPLINDDDDETLDQ